MRRALRSLLFACVGLPLGSVPAMAADLSDQEIIQALTVEQPRDRAIRRALEFIRKQQKRDGAVGDQVRTAMTSMAVMAHLAAGITPDDVEFGAWMHRSLLFVLSQQDENGYFGQVDGSRMYGHGITTLMVAEAWQARLEDPGHLERIFPLFLRSKPERPWV